MDRESYDLINDLVGGDEDWMQLVGIQNPNDLVEDPRAGQITDPTICQECLDPWCHGCEIAR